MGVGEGGGEEGEGSLGVGERGKDVQGIPRESRTLMSSQAIPGIKKNE